ncbi:MAG: 1-(5-phosphoribosyl)-5-[(5-phosphoribosylamino)methylideneamino]imidazole-4-carboxamide isomerase [Kangiellaceae bacterium]|jgi:phosphoribosylformimino-5-aminoimidazole carboxamide ribotide isomerase|nr:1-(5-phosphoribosyl)-5-[(5-phosphoribosylamino)methylideneamino]imidazole-4-carboxamide isomerase [Kangiellaceae bacterium]
MLIIPAIDLKDGRCVRLRQGRMDDATVYGNDPLKMAKSWIDQGARRLHLVDLNGAMAGQPINADVIYDITKAFPNVPIQVGGGIRNIETIELYLDVGVQYVILGTVAVQKPEFVSEVCMEFPDNIIVGLDAVNGKVATHGWEKVSGHDVSELAKKFEDDGVSSIVYTDISRDGMMEGINVDATARLAEAVDIPIVASGGLKNISDVQRLSEVADKGIVGVIAGRSLYEGTLDLTEAQNLADQIHKG